MAVVWLSQGTEAVLEGSWDSTVASTARLFTNDVYSGQTTAQQEALTEASFTEASFTGYTAQALTSGNWTVTGGFPTSAVHASTSFASTAAPAVPVELHGYYITRDSDGLAICFEVFPQGPYLVFASGVTIAFPPTLTYN